MKNIVLYSLILFCCAGIFSSCEKDEIKGTATEAMAGEWYVKVDAIDADGGVVYDDPYGNGYFHLDTYNTASNGIGQMWIDDNSNFELHFKNKINVDLEKLSFNATEAENELTDTNVTITSGQILLGAATTPTGMAADSIVFVIDFEGDTAPGDYGFASYRVAGIRYTGFPADE
ncbi:lipid-binding protein [Carboxylicivirga taeanensis]|uniref:lipid-binding protein n=1 Tax=Carboxylicivirga taeanensis TaxID=1416875 RepID=UPI003F6E247C